MPLEVVTPREMVEPNNPYDKLIYDVSIMSEVKNGELLSKVRVVLWRARILASGAWEKDPLQSRPATFSSDNVYALAAEFPEVATAIGAMHAAVNAINQSRRVI